MKKSILILALSFVALSCKKDYLCTTTSTMTTTTDGVVTYTDTQVTDFKYHGLTKDQKNNIVESGTVDNSSTIMTTTTNLTMTTVCVVD
jgi:hypothetical protein